MQRNPEEEKLNKKKIGKRDIRSNFSFQKDKRISVKISNKGI